MVWIEGATFRMGSAAFYPEEAPVRTVAVDGFFIDPTPVTNSEFGRFVADTGYVTTAEIAPDAADYPGALPEMLRPSSMVFLGPDGPVDVRGPVTWWSFVAGADWRHPTGPDSSIDGLNDHPVVHVAWADVIAYTAWAGKEIPTEAEWELAARGGLDGAEYAWGNRRRPGGAHLANTWQGEFPWQNLAEDGYERTSPVGTFPPNGFGLYDMIGNVWEWTIDWYQTKRPGDEAKACCVPQNPRGGPEGESFDPAMAQIPIPRKVLKGGSHLCAPNYCRRYRPAARFPHPVDTSTGHIGIRSIVRPGR